MTAFANWWKSLEWHFITQQFRCLRSRYDVVCFAKRFSGKTARSQYNNLWNVVFKGKTLLIFRWNSKASFRDDFCFNVNFNFYRTVLALCCFIFCFPLLNWYIHIFFFSMSPKLSTRNVLNLVLNSLVEAQL